MVSDSWTIAEYLEENVPMPSLFMGFCRPYKRRRLVLSGARSGRMLTELVVGT
jgi:hypothetical protein